MRGLPEDFRELLQRSYEGRRALAILDQCRCAACDEKPTPEHLAAHLLATLIDDLVDERSTAEASAARVGFNVRCAAAFLLDAAAYLQQTSNERVPASAPR